MCQLLFSCENNFREPSTQPEQNEKKVKLEVPEEDAVTGLAVSRLGMKWKFTLKFACFTVFTRMGTMTDCILI
jgi:hypothetical protein